MTEKITPIRQQYLQIKRQYPNVIVFFRLGDFYETFDEDARITARELQIVLTSRSMGKGHTVPLAGIPYHAVDNYLAKLINRGYKVAICEQVTRPGETKGLVQREVVRLVTPGTVVEPSLLSGKRNNYLVSVHLDGDKAGIAYVDISTGEFFAAQSDNRRIFSEIERLQPSEIIAARSTDISEISVKATVSRLEDYEYDLENCTQVLLDHFETATLEGFGCENMPLAVQAAGTAVQYIRDTQKGALPQITHLSTYSTEKYMVLDMQTQVNLELFSSSLSGKSEGSLLEVLDLTHTAMGGRLLRKWLGQPLLDIQELRKRQSAVEWFFLNGLERSQAGKLLKDMADLERLINRVRSMIATPREILALKRGLSTIPEIKELLSSSTLGNLKSGLKPFPDIVELIDKAVDEQAPSAMDEGRVIRTGFSPELDELRSKSSNSKQYIADLEMREREKTGIKSLKVGYNRIFGYYIEVSKSNIPQVPDEYIRKQTLVGGERYYTGELKEYESLILNAQERIVELEKNLFNVICGQISSSAESILESAHSVAELDVYAAMAELSVRNNYVRPELNEGFDLIIKDGRHPVVEQSLEENTFIPNDTQLTQDDTRLVILTGPNMSGKSTYLRQVALIVLLAQTGCFVPASSAKIGIVDRIFTRIGAGEDLAAGKSTFMVEMTETANILNNATERSLIILDEIGRGTSTYDGLSIARAVAEYIHSNPRLGAKTLFATHYHELVDLAGVLPRIKNYNVAVSEEGGNVIFLRKIVPGGVDRSYGIHVARLAGLPKPVIKRAQEVLNDLESRVNQQGRKKSVRHSALQQDEMLQIPLFGQKSPLLEELEKLDLNSMTPLEALNKLYEFQQKAKKQ
jgi:DNA mismatch repair protein MutS